MKLRYITVTYKYIYQNFTPDEAALIATGRLEKFGIPYGNPKPGWTEVWRYQITTWTPDTRDTLRIICVPEEYALIAKLILSVPCKSLPIVHELIVEIANKLEEIDKHNYYYHSFKLPPELDCIKKINEFMEVQNESLEQL